MQKILLKLLLLPSLLLFLPAIGSTQNLNNTHITLHLNNVSLKEVIQNIEAQTPFKFLARAEDMENEGAITINVTNQPLNTILNLVLAGRNLQYKQMDGNIILKRTERSATLSKNGRQSPIQKFTINGTIKSGSTGETLIGATVAVNGSTPTTLSNEYGFYSLTLPEGNYTLQITAIGMKTKQLPVSLVKDIHLDILMEEEAKELKAITVTSTAPAQSLKSPQMSIDRLNVQEIKNIPVLFGERDVLKTLQLLPSVKPAGEGNSGFYVRGGSADQNLILMDEAPVYNASHLLGFFSTFNSDAIKDVTLYKGAMPAKYGGRLSSVVDVKMKEGNNQEFSGNGGIGLIASRLTVEGPLDKGKSSFLISGRRTYADLFLKLLGDSSLRNSQLYFYDLNAKMNVTLTQKDKLYLSGYFGRDVLSQSSMAGINWGNATATLRWNHLFTHKLFSNTSLIYSNYDYKIDVNTQSPHYHIQSQIKDWNVKEELQWYANTNNTVTFGANAIFHTIKPGEISVTGNGSSKLQGLQDRYSLENALYASNNWKATDKISVNYGLRVSAFTILGKGDYYTLNEDGNVTDTLHYRRGEVVKTYINLEPRLAINYQLNGSSALKVSYTRNTQNLHLISNTTSASPTDKWVASTNIIRPEIADQVAIGYYKNSKDARYELSVETYYKAMQHQIDYRNGAQVFTNDAIETQLLFGKGRAYGIEWLLKKNGEKLKGWISYTISKTQRRIEGINNNQWYNARQDRTHDISVVAIYQLNTKWTLSATWVYYTGDAVTFPSGKYTVNNEVYFYYSERNAYRMPNYHRLDLGATVQLKKHKHFSSELNFSVYNFYGRANAYQINFRESENDPNKTEAVQTSLFTFVPSLSYNFNF